VLAPIYHISWSASPFGDHPYLVKVPESCRYQFYLTQTEEARYLKEILGDHLKFSTFPRRLNGDVIVDCHCHPDYPPITPQESDTNNNSTVFKAIFGNYASRLQERRPISLENGLGTCNTMTLTHFQQAVNSVIPAGTTLRSVDFSDDILPTQADFENEKGKATCTERDFIKKISVDQSNHVLFLRKIKIMWLMIDAIDMAVWNLEP